MLATIVLAALTFPAAGRYFYPFTTATGAEIGADVWIYATGGGFVTHEEMRSSTPIATMDQHFDDLLFLNCYSGANDRGEQLFIHFVEPIRWGISRAQLSVAGKTTDGPFDRPFGRPGCVLILDNGLTSSVMLPSVVRATRASVCEFIFVNGATAVTAAIDMSAPAKRRKDWQSRNDRQNRDCRGADLVRSADPDPRLHRPWPQWTCNSCGNDS